MMHDFLEQVYAMDHAHDKAIDLILDVFDVKMWAGQFDEIDQIFAAADIDRLNTFSASGLLSAAYCANSRLKNYVPFLERCKAKWPSRDGLWDYELGRVHPESERSLMKTALQLARESIAALLPPGITVTVEPFGDRWTAAFQVAGRLPTTLGFSHSLQDLVQCCVDRREWLIERVRAELDAVDVLGGEVGKSGSAASTADMPAIVIQ